MNKLVEFCDKLIKKDNEIKQLLKIILKNFDLPDGAYMLIYQILNKYFKDDKNDT